ncbi:MAG: L-2-hydroxyglutarate oxidase [Candidatus Limnocylindrales bacterium]
MSQRYDIAIVGGGIVGLATALRLLQRRPGLRLAVVEKETAVALHQSSHNSGVVHAGLYYAAGSRKAILCREGKAELERFAGEHGIPIERCGKLVVAAESSELAGLEELTKRATANGVPGLERVGPERIAEIEPHATGVAGLYSPTTGIVDFERVSLAYADEVRSRGGEILLGRRVRGIERRPGVGESAAEELVLVTPQGEVRTLSVIACAGLWSDRVAAMTGHAGNQRVVPFRGDYLRLRREARHLVRALIYPVNDPRFPFLGIHLTRRIDGDVWAGPNAVLAFAREGYRLRDVVPAELAATLTYRGFLRLGLRFWRFGAGEMWRDLWRPAFAARVRRYVPEIGDDDLEPGPSGVRAQSVRLSGEIVDDFSIGGTGRILHVRNAPSPAATASLAIGRELAELAERRFELA